MKKLLRLLASAVVVSALVGAAIWYFPGVGSGGNKGDGRGRSADAGEAVPVTVALAKVEDMPVYLEGIGTVKARNTVTVRAQVDGKLLSINFKEGQDVAKGDVLAKIDPATYQAQLDQAIAKKALDEALLANTKHDLERYEKVGTLAESQQQIDTQRALVQQQEAQIQSDKAAIDNATTILGYTSVVAPISGRTGIRQVDEGNLVRSGDASGLVVITEVQPISVIFTLPQQQLVQVRKGDAGGQLTAVALTTDGKSELDSGALHVIDNQIDSTTGTVRLKAEFPNGQMQLWPGQFVNVKLLVDTLKQVVTIPATAIQRGPSGTFVYLVGDGDRVGMRPVQVSEQTDTVAVITQGIGGGDQVVTSGFGRLSDGAKITVGGDAAAPDSPGSGSSEKKHDGGHRHQGDNASIGP
jgi:multidrug efflux system membrane fusion protein